MENKQGYPEFEHQFNDLNYFILTLVDRYKAGELNSWEQLETQVNDFFTSPRMDDMETRVPGWEKMASFSGGITLVHVMCVFLGMYMLPEFQSLNAHQQDLMKWVILFHDIDKFHIRGKKDTLHAFRSAVVAANRLPQLGFPCTEEYSRAIQPWSEFTLQAFIEGRDDSAPTPDNRELSKILQGIDSLFGEGSSAALIVKVVLLHISLHVDDQYPTPAPLTIEEARRYIHPDLFPLMRVMMLSDNEGWSLFTSDPNRRKQQRDDTLAAFEEVQKFLS